MAPGDAATNANEQLVLDFIHACYGQHIDIDAATALMSDHFVWQLHVPLSPVVVGREAERGVGETQRPVDGLSTGMIEGSEIRTVVSTGDTVIVERVEHQPCRPADRHRPGAHVRTAHWRGDRNRGSACRPGPLGNQPAGKALTPITSAAVPP